MCKNCKHTEVTADEHAKALVTNRAVKGIQQEKYQVVSPMSSNIVLLRNGEIIAGVEKIKIETNPETIIILVKYWQYGVKFTTPIRNLGVSEELNSLVIEVY